MTELLILLAEVFLILGATVLAQSVVLSARFGRRAKGFLWPAACWSWSFLARVVIIEWIVGMVSFFVFTIIPIPLFPRLLCAVFVGLYVAAAPNALEYFLVIRNPTEQKLKSSIVKLAETLNLIIIREFAAAIKTLIEQDNIDLQQGCHPLLPDLKGKEIGRRIRKLYAWHMRAIAYARKDGTFLRRDVGFVPWDNFYILVPCLGRKKFLACIWDDPPSPPPLENWDGSERRRKHGTKEQRKRVPNDPTSGYSRCYDDPDLILRIESGNEALHDISKDDKAFLLE